MSSIWLTYAWNDNTDADVDFAAQELAAAGLDVKLDRWNISAGRRLWEQIERFIQDETQCDAWLMYATENSLGSEACREEYAYALNRALRSRDSSFSVIALFPDSVDEALIPAGIRTRLYVSLTDPDWKERIVAAAEGRAPQVQRRPVAPFLLRVHNLVNNDPTQNYAIEIRPRAGTWSPFIALVPIGEKDSVQPTLIHGPAGGLPAVSIMGAAGSGTTQDGLWHYMKATNQATPTQSYYLMCAELPSVVAFGKEASGKASLYTVKREHMLVA
jgi:TIR domain